MSGRRQPPVDTIKNKSSVGSDLLATSVFPTRVATDLSSGFTVSFLVAFLIDFFLILFAFSCSNIFL